MFSSQEYIDSKTGRDNLNRFQYLQALVTEFQDTASDDAKTQVLANLANFAYDPINYPHLKQLNVTELFLDMLSEPNETFVEFGIGGLCNFCLDEDCRRTIIENNGIQEIVNCLSSPNEETVLSAITTLIYLKDKTTEPELTSAAIMECMTSFSGSSNSRLSNLAKTYLETVLLICGEPPAVKGLMNTGNSLELVCGDNAKSKKGKKSGNSQLNYPRGVKGPGNVHKRKHRRKVLEKRRKEKEKEQKEQAKEDFTKQNLEYLSNTSWKLDQNVCQTVMKHCSGRKTETSDSQGKKSEVSSQRS